MGIWQRKESTKERAAPCPIAPQGKGLAPPHWARAGCYYVLHLFRNLPSIKPLFMKQVLVYGLLVAMLILAGCPVQTKNSIDEGSYDIPKAMNGVWQEAETSSGKAKKTYVLEVSNRKGNLKCYDADSTGTPDKSKQTPVIMSQVKGKVFLFAYRPEDDMDAAGYYIFEFRPVSDKEFKLVPVKEKSIDYNASPEEITKFLEQNINNNSIYDLSDVVRYVKK
jgi:hypothetical protein